MNGKLRRGTVLLETRELGRFAGIGYTQFEVKAITDDWVYLKEVFGRGERMVLKTTLVAEYRKLSIRQIQRGYKLREVWTLHAVDPFPEV